MSHSGFLHSSIQGTLLITCYSLLIIGAGIMKEEVQSVPSQTSESNIKEMQHATQAIPGTGLCCWGPARDDGAQCAWGHGEVFWKTLTFRGIVQPCPAVKGALSIRESSSSTQRRQVLMKNHGQCGQNRYTERMRGMTGLQF